MQKEIDILSKEKRPLTLFEMLFGALLQYPSVFFKDIASIFRDEKEISIPKVPEKLDLSNNKLWIKAELHQHHLYEIPLPELLKLYKDEGYIFIVIALKDNERRFFPEEYSTNELLVVEGVEQAFKSADKKFLHFNAFRINGPFRFTDYWSVRKGLRRLKRKNEDALLIIDHPSNKRWEVEDLKASVEEGAKLFELNPSNNTPLDYSVNLWDRLLSAGIRTWAVLSNDHHAHQRLFIDGYGHLVIQAERLTLSSIRSALLSGAFYASEHHHKARVKRYIPDISSGEVYLEIESEEENKIRFIGKDGNLLKEVKGDKAIYKIKGDEMYIRAEVVDSEGKRLFLQPVGL